MMPESRTIPALLEEQAQKFGQKEAVVTADTRLTYRELLSEVRLRARGLAASGIGRGDHVAILMGNRVEWITAFLAIQQLGAVAVSLNTWATPRELEHMLDHAEVKYLVSVRRFRRSDYGEIISEFRGRLTHLQKIIWLGDGETKSKGGDIGWDSLVATASTTDEEIVVSAGRSVTPEDVAMLLYTSGSTAAPKGILLNHHGWISNSFQIGERQHVTSEDRLWLAVSLFWSFGSVNAFPNLLTHGGCVVLQEFFDAEEALDIIERERCSVIYGTPNIIQALSEQQKEKPRRLESLRTGAMIGTPEQLMTAVRLGAKEICNVYGLSETFGNCAVTDGHLPLDIRLHTVGRPLPGVTINIVQPETGETLSAGEVGEIRVKGPLFTSYFKESVKTHAAYDYIGFFCTGDLGSLDDEGYLHYRGRLKEMVKSGGINVAPIEVEETLMRHPAVQNAFVVGLPDPVLDEVLAAAVVLRPGANCEKDELARFCRAEMAAYKVPGRFIFIAEEKLPLTTTGKVQKNQMHVLFAELTGSASGAL